VKEWEEEQEGEDILHLHHYSNKIALTRNHIHTYQKSLAP
jgi:hypothetical protein